MIFSAVLLNLEWVFGCKLEMGFANDDAIKQFHTLMEDG